MYIRKLSISRFDHFGSSSVDRMSPALDLFNVRKGRLDVSRSPPQRHQSRGIFRLDSKTNSIASPRPRFLLRFPVRNFFSYRNSKTPNTPSELCVSREKQI